MAGQVKQSIDFLDSDMLRSVGDLHDLVANANLAFFDDSEIKARSPMRNQQCWHLRVVHPYADAIAGDARLSYFKQCATDPVAISDANLVIWQTIDRQVFAELPVPKVMPLKVRLPVAIRVELIDHH